MPSGWDPFRLLDSLAALWSTGALQTGPATVYRTLFDSARTFLVGRTFTVRTGAGDLRLTLTALDARLDPLALSVGQLDDVHLAAEDIRFGPHRIARVTAVAHNVHVRPAAVPELVAGPVDLTVTLDAADVAERLQRRVSWLLADVDAHATATLRWRHRPRLGQLEIDVAPDATTLWCKPLAVLVRGRRLPLPATTPAYPIRIRPLPSGMALQRIERGPGAVHLHGVLPTWREAVPLGRLQDLVKQVRAAAGLLDLSGWTRHH